MHDPVTIVFESDELDYLWAVLADLGGPRMLPVRDEREHQLRLQIRNRITRTKRALDYR